MTANLQAVMQFMLCAKSMRDSVHSDLAGVTALCTGVASSFSGRETIAWKAGDY